MHCETERWWLDVPPPGSPSAKAPSCTATAVAAEVSADGKSWQRTPAIELRVFTGSGFRAGLSEQFNLPYVFGAGFLRQRGETGPEAGAGNDCANFLVYAWRRAGHRLGQSFKIPPAERVVRHVCRSIATIPRQT